MTKATFYFDGNVPYGFLISGHSGFAENGEDIVCASVSSASYMVANTITEILKVNAKIDVDETNGKMKLIVNKEQRHITKDILLGLKLHLDNLAEEYPKFLKTLTEV